MINAFGMLGVILLVVSVVVLLDGRARRRQRQSQDRAR
jgi:hypothetical protein